MISLWPQALLATILLLLCIVPIINHGQPMKQTNYHAAQSIWISATIALILGCGGFWHW